MIRNLQTLAARFLMGGSLLLLCAAIMGEQRAEAYDPPQPTGCEAPDSECFPVEASGLPPKCKSDQGWEYCDIGANCHCPGEWSDPPPFPPQLLCPCR